MKHRNGSGKNGSAFQVVAERGRITVIAPRELAPRDAERLALELLRATAKIRVQSEVAGLFRAGRTRS